MKVHIRTAKVNDYIAVENIMKEVNTLHIDWRPDIYKNIDPVLPKDMFMEHLEKEEILVAETDSNQIVGIAIYITRYVSGGPMVKRKVLFIDSIAVTEDFRGKGVGHNLLDHIRMLCKKHQYDGLELQVNARNTAAKAMYEKYGFTEKSINMEFLF